MVVKSVKSVMTGMEEGRTEETIYAVLRAYLSGMITTPPPSATCYLVDDCIPVADGVATKTVL